MPSAAPVQLVAFSFPADAEYRGGLIGAVERLEAGDGVRVLDVLFVRRDPDSGELAAVEARGGEAAGMVGKLLDFRFEADAGRAAGLAGDAGTDRGLSGEDVADIGASLGPGEAAAVIVIEHSWTELLERAAEAAGGARIADQVVPPAAAETYRT